MSRGTRREAASFLADVGYSEDDLDGGSRLDPAGADALLADAVNVVGLGCIHTALRRRTAVLLGGRRGYGVAVVAADEDDRRAQRGREVERRVEVALARRALAEIGHRHRRLAFQLQHIADALTCCTTSA